MVDELMSDKIALYRQFLRILSDKEIRYSEFAEIINLIDKAKNSDDLDCICDKFQVAPF